MKVELRPSKKEEADLAIPLIYSSGPPSFEYVFKNDKHTAADFLHYAFQSEGGEFSYQNHYSLYFDGEMIGIGCEFDAQKASSFTFYDAKKILQFYGLRSFPIIKHGLKIEQLIKLPQKQEIVIGHLGITPKFRGKGFGTKLIHGLMEKANTKEESKFVLDVSEENPKAQFLYERLGFVSTKKNVSSLKNKHSYVANHFRMELNLSA